MTDGGGLTQRHGRGDRGKLVKEEATGFSEWVGGGCHCSFFQDDGLPSVQETGTRQSLLFQVTFSTRKGILTVPVQVMVVKQP